VTVDDAIREPPQPITFTECVGAYTGPDGSFDVQGKLLAAALTWAGHASDQADAALSYQAFLTGQVIEIVRRTRRHNPNLAGVMPFTVIHHRYPDVKRYADMRPKPVADQMRASCQPVLLSWELWTRQVYAGSVLRPVAHVVNDGEDGRDLQDATLRYQLRDEAGRTLASGEAPLPDVPYFESRPVPLSIPLPADAATGDSVLEGRIVTGERTVSTQSIAVFIAARAWPLPRRLPARTVTVFDGAGETMAALRRLRLPFKRVRGVADLRPGNCLVVGSGAWGGRLRRERETLREWVRAGGRVLLLRQPGEAYELDWLGAELRLARSGGRKERKGMWVNVERPGHPAFQGLARERLRLWSDYTGWAESQPGRPAVHPVTIGFHPTRDGHLERLAILANYGRGLATMALCEVFDGAGSVILSGFDLVRRAGRDPVADRLLRNLVLYAASKDTHRARPLIDSPIVWGDYASERGLVVGLWHGLRVHTAPGPASRGGGVVGGGQWEAAHVPSGRRPFGPFRYNGLCYVVDMNPESETGSGVFHARCPPGRQRVVTEVRNPGSEARRLAVEVNGRPGASALIPPGASRRLRAPIGDGATKISVRYTGHKSLVLVRTAFD
jgi:hypothetical protein